MGKPKSSPLSSRKAETTTNRTTTTTKRFARKMNAPKKQQQQQRESDPSNGVVVVDDDDDDDDEKKKKKKKDETNKTSPATRKTTKETPPKNKNTIGDQEENDPYAFDNAKELFGKVDEEVLTVEDDEEDVEMEAEKYFANKRGESLALFGKKLLMKRDARPVAGAVASSEEGTKRRRVSFATEGDEEADVVQKSPAKNDEKNGEADVVQKTLMSPAKSDEKNGEALFDEALATEIKLTPEKPIQFKRQKTPSPVKQIVIPEASTRNNLIQSSDPQTHLQVLERHGNTSHQEQQQTLASTLWLLKKIASNTQYRRRLSRERPHFATSMFTAALKIAGKSATDAKLRLAAIALAYLFSLEIKTFSRVLDSMDIALGVAACVDEVNFIENVNDDEDDDEECIVVAGVDNEVEQTVETSLSALKFLPNEKSACAKNIALLLAFRALQWGSEEEEEEEEENGQEGQQSKDKQRPIFGGDATSRALRARFSRSGFITSVAKLANESCKDLVQSIHSRKTKKNKLNQEEEEEMKRKARKSCARLFRCARVIEAATYASTETVTILASSNLPVWESSPSSKSDNDDNGDADGADDDAFGEPTPSNANTLSSCVLKLAEVSLLSEEEEKEEEEEEEEEEEPKEDRGNITAASIPTTTTTTTVSTPPRPISGRKGGEEDNNNNSSFLQIGSPATVGASPVFGQVAKSPGAALDSWLAKSPKDGDVDMSPKAKARENSNNNNNNNNNSKKNNWSLARCLIETLPTLTLLTSRSMRPRAKSLHGIQTSEYLNPNIDVRLSLATLKACVFALTNSTNENTVGARAASSRDGLHGIVAALAYFSTMRGCALYGEFAGFVPKKDNMEGTVPDAYKEAATELLNASMCLLVNITEANPRAKKELLQLQLNCAPFGIGKAEDFEKKKTKTKNDGKKSSNEKMISPLVPFPTVLARIFTHAGGAKMHRAQDEEGEEGQSQGDDDDDDDDDEVTADMLDDDDDAATANADLDPSYGEDLITQAYSSLLLAFLVENNGQALRRTADQALPRGRGRQNTNGKTIRTTKNGVQAMVDTLERFHAFHDTLDAMSASSSESLKRVVEWLKSTLT